MTKTITYSFSGPRFGKAIKMFRTCKGAIGLACSLVIAGSIVAPPTYAVSSQDCARVSAAVATLGVFIDANRTRSQGYLARGEKIYVQSIDNGSIRFPAAVNGLLAWRYVANNGYIETSEACPARSVVYGVSMGEILTEP